MQYNKEIAGRIIRALSAFFGFMAVVAIILASRSAMPIEEYVGTMFACLMTLALSVFCYFWLPDAEFEV